MIKVGVIRGGVSPEYEVSLETGGNVLSHLLSDYLNKKYKPVDLLIDKDGIWYMNGISTTPENIVRFVDVVFNALHGDFGEDGKVQRIFDSIGLPYTGSGELASAIAYNKLLAKEEFKKLGIKTPKHILFSAYQKGLDGPIENYAKEKAREVWGRISPPWIVKPLTGGSSMGIHVCKTYEDLVKAFNIGVNEKVSVLVEEMLEGKEATVGVIEGFRDQKHYTLPAIEVCMPKRVCPGNFSRIEKDELERLAVVLHKGLNLRHYSHSDFIIHPKRGIYILEVNTLPGLTQQSLINSSLSAVGATIPEFIDHIIKLALINTK